MTVSPVYLRRIQASEEDRFTDGDKNKVYVNFGANSERQALATRSRVANACRSELTLPQLEIWNNEG